MKNSIKHLFMLCLFGIISPGAMAYDFSADNSDGVMIYYNITSTTDLTCEVVNQPYSIKYFGEVNIPSSVIYNSNSYSVTSIGERAFSSCSDLTSVTIPESVTSIGDYAFLYCSGLTSVTIPESVTSIGEFAFSSCSGLTSVTIGNSVTSIGDYAFSNCSGLKNVTIPNSVTSIGERAFSSCSGLTNVTIPESVTSIGEYAFYGCTSLPVIDNIRYADTYLVGVADKKLSTCKIKQGTKWIGGSAFSDCIDLTSIEIPNSVTEIGSYAFQYCSGLTSVTIPESVTSIGKYAFYSCSGLTSVTIGNSVTSIGESAFLKCSGLTSVTIPNSVTSIGSSAFYYCSGLTSVTIGNSVTSIGEFAFYGCYFQSDKFVNNSSLNAESNNYWGATICDIRTEDGLCIKDNNVIKYFGNAPCVTIPNFVTSIGNNAFENCEKLTSVIIGNSVTSIGYSAFRGCSGLTSVEIPNSVISIGSSAFYDCSGLTSVTIGNSVTSIGDYAFRNCSGLTSVTIPESVTSIGKYAFYSCSGLTSVTIGNSVTSIGESAFQSCSGLTSVTIGNSVTSIGEFAFYGCYFQSDKFVNNSSLNAESNNYWGATICDIRTEDGLCIKDNNVIKYFGNAPCVTIPNFVTSIGDYAFENCLGLTNVTIPESVTSIGISAFERCSGLTSVTIPNSVTSIGKYAFYSCSGLTSVTIGNSVTSIGEYAFYNCTKLKNIIAEGINAPTIGSLCFYIIYSCSLHVPLGSNDAYASKFGTYFKSGNSYGNTIVAYSAYSKNSDGDNFDARYSFKVWDASSDVTLNEGIEKVYVPVEATVNDLKYKRTFNNTDWQALYVPFELGVTTDLAGFNVYEISTSSADAINVTLMTDGKTSANTPYLIKAKATGEQTIPVSSKTVKVTVENTNSDLTDFEIVGTYEKLNYGDIAGDWYALKGGKFMKAGEGAYLNPYRFYLKRKASSSKESIEININEPTGITSYDNDNDDDNDDDNENLYNLNGMRVDSNYKGIVIINGKKYLKK